MKITELRAIASAMRGSKIEAMPTDADPTAGIAITIVTARGRVKATSGDSHSGKRYPLIVSATRPILTIPCIAGPSPAQLGDGVSIPLGVDGEPSNILAQS